MGFLDDAKQKLGDKFDEAKDTLHDLDRRDVLASGTPAPDEPETDPSHPTGPTGPSDPAEPTEPSEPTAPTGPMGSGVPGGGADRPEAAPQTPAGSGGGEGDPNPVPTDPSPVPPEPGSDPNEDLARPAHGAAL
jgi:hypothetical protein